MLIVEMQGGGTVWSRRLDYLINLAAPHQLMQASLHSACTSFDRGSQLSP